MTGLRDIARLLGGEVVGGQVLAPGPDHTRKDRSLSVRTSANAPDGFMVFSHAGDDWRECRDYVREQLGLPGETGTRRPSEDHRRPPEPKPENDYGRSGALALWRYAVDPRATTIADLSSLTWT